MQVVRFAQERKVVPRRRVPVIGVEQIWKCWCGHGMGIRGGWEVFQVEMEMGHAVESRVGMGRRIRCHVEDREELRMVLGRVVVTECDEKASINI